MGFSDGPDGGGDGDLGGSSSSVIIVPDDGSSPGNHQPTAPCCTALELLLCFWTGDSMFADAWETAFRSIFSPSSLSASSGFSERSRSSEVTSVVLWFCTPAEQTFLVELGSTISLISSCCAGQLTTTRVQFIVLSNNVVQNTHGDAARTLLFVFAGLKACQRRRKSA